ncbi:MAG TPA: hypothetical protein VFA21_09330 [Pyrinomonadaceae bacterium]|nr:hypothetical protein [Pyrinomonadaceae bacterium]
MFREQAAKALGAMRWLPAYGLRRLTRRRTGARARHVVIALADHFEPAYLPEAPHDFAPLDVQERRLEEWCREYPKIFREWRDADGFPFRHTYFSPAEQYDESLTERLAGHCRDGWGEVEIHLHHGLREPDTSEATRRALAEFRDALVRHGCLSRWEGDAQPRYAFVHGNWALANSAGGRFCGVDEEMQLLADTGCYADMTLPSFPSPAQVSKINSLYECEPPLARRAPHRGGRDLRAGRAPQTFPLIVQGPLGLDFGSRASGLPLPKIENGDVRTARPPTLERLRLWRRAAVSVEGKPEWVFVKLHCHGMNPLDREAMLGRLMQEFLRELTEESRASEFALHFVTAREMVNMILAACDGRDGDPGQYRDYRLRLITPHRAA